MKEDIIILDSAINFEALKQDLGLLPPPENEPNWITLKPVKNGYYQAAGVTYIFDGEQLVEYATESTTEK